jgi:hypothetical protein
LFMLTLSLPETSYELICCLQAKLMPITNTCSSPMT